MALDYYELRSRADERKNRQRAIWRSIGLCSVCGGKKGRSKAEQSYKLCPRCRENARRRYYGQKPIPRLPESQRVKRTPNVANIPHNMMGVRRVEQADGFKCAEHGG